MRFLWKCLQVSSGHSVFLILGIAMVSKIEKINKFNNQSSITHFSSEASARKQIFYVNPMRGKRI